MPTGDEVDADAIVDTREPHAPGEEWNGNAALARESVESVEKPWNERNSRRRGVSRAHLS
jgi:hypothetical protein